MLRYREDEGAAATRDAGARESRSAGRRTRTQGLEPRAGTPDAAHEIAAQGRTGAPGALPHLDRIQRSFGAHDVRGVPSFVGGAARQATAALGARAYAADGEVAFGAEPDLFTASHEAAHVVQQRGGVQLAGGVGATGDTYERHADAVADRVVRGESAEALLDNVATAGPSTAAAQAGVQLRALQLQEEGGDDPDDVATQLASGGAITRQLADDALADYEGTRDHDGWWRRSGRRAAEVLRAATPAGVRAGGAHAATVRDWLRRLGPSPETATLAMHVGQLEPLLAWADSGALNLIEPQRNAIVAALMTGALPWTPFGAMLAIERYELASDPQAWFDRWYPHGQIPALLRALPGSASPGGGGYQHRIRDLLQRLQRHEADSAAAEVGLTDHEGMVDAEAAHLRANPDVVAREHNDTYENNQPLDASVAAQQNARIQAAIPGFVDYMTRHHPEIGFTTARIRADAARCHQMGSMAFVEQPASIAVVGVRFAELCEANPAYAVPTIVHELYGHNEYGDSGAPETEAGQELYEEARSRPGMPASLTAANGEGSFGYIETEIYSLLREVDYYTPTAEADRGRPGVHTNYSPREGIESRLLAARRLYDERVATAQLRGLYRRLRADPHFQPRAQPPRPGVPADPLEPFRQAVRAIYPGRAATILE